MEEFALIKSRVNLNHVNWALVLISDSDLYMFVKIDEVKILKVFLT